MQRSTFTINALVCLFSFFFHEKPVAQDVQREIGIRASSFQNFSAVYKWQKAENKYGRLTAAFIGLGLDSDSNADSFNAGFGLTLGNEHRRSLADRTDFIHGLQYVVQVSYSDTPDLINQSTFQGVAGISYLLGVQYNASDRFNVGIEFLPSLLVRYTETNNNDRLSIDATASFTNAALFATYRFSSSPGKSGK